MKPISSSYMIYDNARGLVPPHPGSFATVGTDVNIPATMKDLGPKFFILTVSPDFFERLRFQIAQFVLGVFVKTTGRYEPVPCDYGIMPQAPTMIGQRAFELVRPIRQSSIPAILTNSWD